MDPNDTIAKTSIGLIITFNLSKTYKGLKKDQLYHDKMTLAQCIWKVLTNLDVKNM